MRRWPAPGNARQGLGVRAVGECPPSASGASATLADAVGGSVGRRSYWPAHRSGLALPAPPPAGGTVHCFGGQPEGAHSGAGRRSFRPRLLLQGLCRVAAGACA